MKNAPADWKFASLSLPLCQALTVVEALDGLSATHISRSPPPVGALELSRESGGGPLEYLGMML